MSMRFVLVLMAVTAARGQFFEDVTESAGVAFVHRASRTVAKHLPEAIGGGVAMLDFDRDGLVDLFFPNGAAIVAAQKDKPGPVKEAGVHGNRLYRNLGGMRFEDVTAAQGVGGHGYAMGVAVGDVDNDGYPDLLVANYGSVILYRNRGGKGFEDVTRAAGLEGASGWMTSAGFLDADNDGDLDLFIARYVKHTFEGEPECGVGTRQGRSYCHPDQYEALGSLLYRNEGGIRFTDVSKESGIAAHEGKSLGVAFADFDGDGLTDVAVANDSTAQFLFRNLGGLRFEETALGAAAAFNDDGEDFGGMGIDVSDLDQDGRPDILTTTLSLQRYAFFRNAGKGMFEYATPESKLGSITHSMAGWGLRVFDADNDGRAEVLLANGHVMDNIAMSQPAISYTQPPVLLRFDGRVFEDASGPAGPLFGRKLAGRGLAVGDLDNDGCLDAVIGVNDGPPVVARNRCGDGGWVSVRLEGAASNRMGLGARLTLTLPDGTVRYAVAQTAGSYLSAQDERVHFGLGRAESGKLVVRWPSGRIQEMGVRAGQRLVIREGRDVPP